MPAPDQLSEELRLAIVPAVADIRKALAVLRARLQQDHDVPLHDLAGLAGSELEAARPSQEAIDLEAPWPESAQAWIAHERAKAAIREASCELIILGEARPAAAWTSDEYAHFPWRRGGTSGGAQVSVPRTLYPMNLLAPAVHRETGQVALFPTRFLEELGIDLEVSEHVQQCLREAVEAHRRNLPLAAGIMLGAASEGVWLEFAEQVIRSATGPNVEQINKELERPRPSAAAVQDLVADFLQEKPNRRLLREAGVTAEDLRARAEYYRTLRNYAHPHVEQRPIPDFENMSMALLEAVRYFRALYIVIETMGISPRAGEQ